MQPDAEEAALLMPASGGLDHAVPQGQKAVPNNMSNTKQCHSPKTLVTDMSNTTATQPAQLHSATDKYAASRQDIVHEQAMMMQPPCKAVGQAAEHPGQPSGCVMHTWGTAVRLCTAASDGRHV